MRTLYHRNEAETHFRRSPSLLRSCWVIVAFLAPLLLALGPVLNELGATAVYGVSTSKTDVNGVWRKVQAPLQIAAQYMVPEWDDLEQVPEFSINWSTREITVPLDLSDDVGIASIPEGGYEARPGSPNPTDATLTWILLNGRFTVSKTAKWIDQRNRAAMLERQLAYQGRKKLEAISRRLAEYMYGFSTAIMAKVAVDNAATQDLKDMYGIAGLGSTTSPFAVVNPFRVNDYVAFLDPAGPALRAIRKITAITPATPSITVDSDPVTTANDLIVFANSLENTTLAGGTDYNAGLVGFLDAALSTSLHGVSSATFPKWAPGFSDATGGRFTGIRLVRGRQGIDNNGGGMLNEVTWDQGVERDVIAYLQAAVRFSDPYGMVMDGEPKAKGVTFRSTRFVPEGYVFARDKKKSLKKMTLLPKPSANPAWDDATKLIDQSGFIFALDYPCALVWTNRANLAYWSGVTRQ